MSKQVSIALGILVVVMSLWFLISLAGKDYEEKCEAQGKVVVVINGALMCVYPNEIIDSSHKDKKGE